MLSMDDFRQAVVTDLSSSVNFETFQDGDMTKEELMAVLLRETGIEISVDTAVTYMRKLAKEHPEKYRCLKVRHDGKSSIWVLRGYATDGG